LHKSVLGSRAFLKGAAAVAVKKNNREPKPLNPPKNCPQETRVRKTEAGPFLEEFGARVGVGKINL
jgi:hypothetical protein